jgi:hypothetical protein
MKRIALLLALLAPAPALAQGDSPFAGWGESSGSLPPEYAWEYTVTFHEDRSVTVDYCKGYANDAPGCATISRRLSKADLAALHAALDPLAAALAESPPQADPNPPIGGGASWAWVNAAGEDIRLPAFPAEPDRARVQALLALLQSYTPKAAVAAAERRAKAP